MIDMPSSDSADRFWNNTPGRARSKESDRPPNYPAILFPLSSVQPSSDRVNGYKRGQYSDKSQQQTEMSQIRF